MKILHSILFVYFTIFYIVGSANLSSILENISSDIVFSLKDFKKQTDCDEQENEQENEQEKEPSALVYTSLNLEFFQHCIQKDRIFHSDQKVLESGIPIIIPPPEQV